MLLQVLFLPADIPPARQEKVPETVAKSLCRTNPCRMSHVGWHVPWVLRAQSIWEGVLGSINQSPTQRTWGSADLGTNSSISIPSLESSLSCFLVDILVKPAFATSIS